MTSSGPPDETPEQREARLKAKLDEIKSAPPPATAAEAVIRDDEITQVIQLACERMDETSRRASARMKRVKKESGDKLEAIRVAKEKKP